MTLLLVDTFFSTKVLEPKVSTNWRQLLVIESCRDDQCISLSRVVRDNDDQEELKQRAASLVKLPLTEYANPLMDILDPMNIARRN